MRRNTRWVLIAVLGVIAIVAGLGMRWALSGDPPVTPVTATTVANPSPGTEHLFGSSHPRAQSPFYDAERKRFFALLSGQFCDTLVVPVQDQDASFDRATRSLMTAVLAQTLAADPKRCVVDPYLASRALGDGLRRIEIGDVRALAAAVKATTIVTTYAGHDTRMRMGVFMRVESCTHAGTSPACEEESKKTWIELGFNDELPPFEVWQELMPEVLSEISSTQRLPDSAVNTISASGFVLPPAPEQLIVSSGSAPLERAERYQLLAMLAPYGGFRATERFFEKSWLAAAEAPDGDLSRRIRARALLHLGYRPAAHALLRSDDGAEARLLRALLDGDLVGAREFQDALETELSRLLAGFEILDLTHLYENRGQRSELPKSLLQLAKQPAWTAWVQQRAGDGDSWSRGDNALIQRALDRTHPIKGFSLNDFVRGRQVVADAPTDTEIALLPIRHVNRLLEQNKDPFCCGSFVVQPQAFDFIDLAFARAQANLEKEVELLLYVKGLTDRAADVLDAADVEFSGHPHFALLRANLIRDRMTGEAEQDTRENQARIQLLADTTAFWEQSLNKRSQRAMIHMGVPSEKSMPFIFAYGSQFPPHADWGFWELNSPVGKARLQRSLAYNVNDMAGLNRLIGLMAHFAGEEQAQTEVSELGQRFRGSEDIVHLQTRFPLAGEDPQAKIARMRQLLASNPESWSAAMALANQLMSEGDYASAAEVAQNYPGFRENSGIHTVALSNQVEEIASALFWRGAADEAATAYAIGLQFENGSNSSMTAKQRSRLLAGDYVGYAAHAVERISRYDSPYAYRDYLSMLFAMGYAEDAWPAFVQVAGKFDILEPWKAALIGQRVAGADANEVGDWASSEPIRGIRIGLDRPALPFALMSGVVDRIPPADLHDLLVRIEGQPLHIHRKTGDVVRKEDYGWQPAFSSAFRSASRTHPNQDSPVESGYIWFGDAIVAFKAGDHAAAVEDFDLLAGLYGLEQGPFTFAMPYFAFSAAKTGDKLGLETFLQSLPLQLQEFDFHLAMGFFAGIAEDHERAIQHFRAAFHKRPYSADRVIPSAYQYAEACILLFEETGDTRYRELALDWARKLQRVDPVWAWPYALEAKYGERTGSRRMRAVALAWYLDRNSLWLSEISQAELAQAQSWLKQNNPFTQANSRSKDNASAANAEQRVSAELPQIVGPARAGLKKRGGGSKPRPALNANSLDRIGPVSVALAARAAASFTARSP